MIILKYRRLSENLATTYYIPEQLSFLVSLYYLNERNIFTEVFTSQNLFDLGESRMIAMVWFILL